MSNFSVRPLPNAQPVVQKPELRTPPTQPTLAPPTPQRLSTPLKPPSHQPLDTQEAQGYLAQAITHTPSEMVRDKSQTLPDIFGHRQQANGTKAVYALGNDIQVTGSAASLAAKAGHSSIGQAGLGQLGSQDKLTLVGHGSDSQFGGMSARALAQHLKESGVSSLAKISLKGCDSDYFAQQLFQELQTQGIAIGSITGRSGKVAIASNGRTLVQQEGLLRHQAQGSKLSVSAKGVQDVYAQNKPENVQQASQAILKLGHSGLLDPAADLANIKVKSTNENSGLRTTHCHLDAVCWNWALFGGRAEVQDPRVTLSDQGYKPPGRGIADRQTNYLAHLVSTGFVDGQAPLERDDASPLRMVAYFSKNQVSLEHIEFAYEGVTITKGLERNLKAVTYDADHGDNQVRSIGIKISSLSDDHKQALQLLGAAAPELTRAFESEEEVGELVRSVLAKAAQAPTKATEAETAADTAENAVQNLDGLSQGVLQARLENVERELRNTRSAQNYVQGLQAKTDEARAVQEAIAEEADAAAADHAPQDQVQAARDAATRAGERVTAAQTACDSAPIQNALGRLNDAKTRIEQAKEKLEVALGRLPDAKRRKTRQT